jgi:hypothetical protein
MREPDQDALTQLLAGMDVHAAQQEAEFCAIRETLTRQNAELAEASQRLRATRLAIEAQWPEVAQELARTAARVEALLQEQRQREEARRAQQAAQQRHSEQRFRWAMGED